LGDVLKNANFANVIDWPIACIDLSRLAKLSISLRLPPTLRNLQLGNALSVQVIKSSTFDPNIVTLHLDTGWTPPGGHWATAGEFFHETAEFFDPIQGAVAILRSNCLSYRTFNPMTAWTYSSGDASPDHVDYSSAHVVGSTVTRARLGLPRGCQRWIVLRNPWGNTEATASVLDATISTYDVSWWRLITLKAVDGVFAMEIGAFKKYFAGFGTAY
jgi:hypothetical protein